MKWQLCVWVWRQLGNEVILGTVGGSSRPIIVLGTWGPTFFSEQGPVLSKSGPETKVTCTKCYRNNGEKNVDQILHKYSTPWLDELITFWRSWGQSEGRYKIRYLSELSRLAEASIPRFGHRSIIWYRCRLRLSACASGCMSLTRHLFRFAIYAEMRVLKYFYLYRSRWSTVELLYRPAWRRIRRRIRGARDSTVP